MNNIEKNDMQILTFPPNRQTIKILTFELPDYFCTLSILEQNKSLKVTAQILNFLINPFFSSLNM